MNILIRGTSANGLELWSFWEKCWRLVAPRHVTWWFAVGAALRATALVSRVTKDVDVIATRGEVDGEITPAWPLPDSLRKAVADVAAELALPAHWLNASTSMLVGPLEDLPPEVWADLHERAYGPRLRIAFVGRAGQIPLKLHAAVGRREARDLDDLIALAPDAEEFRRALAASDRSRCRRREAFGGNSHLARP